LNPITFCGCPKPEPGNPNATRRGLFVSVKWFVIWIVDIKENRGKTISSLSNIRKFSDVFHFWFFLKETRSRSREATHRFRTSNNAKSNPEIKGCNSIFFRHDALRVSGHELFTSTPHVFLLNIFINKTERSIHFYWIHFLNKIVTWLTREYVYLWYRLLEINVGTRDTAADEML
jgi:hypothetical protein